jgi:hypothetical protein
MIKNIFKAIGCLSLVVTALNPVLAQENQSPASVEKLKMQNICDVLFGFVDLFFCILIFLPLYPNEINGYVYSVNLVSYTQTTGVNLMIYWFAFVFLIVLGLVEIIIAKMNVEKGNKILIGISFIINIGAVLLLALTREAYAVSIVFLLLLIKTSIFIKRVRL